MKKLLALTLSLVLVATMFTACGGESNNAEGGAKEITVGMRYEPETLDPANFSADSARFTIHLSGEPLLRNTEGEAKPGAAESYEVSEDGKTWTFHLRESSFSDGTPVTANDFVYSILRTLNPENGLENSYLLYDIAGAESYNMGESGEEDVAIKAVDEQTLEITTVSNTFPLAFTEEFYAPVKKDAVEAAGESYGSEAEHLVTNGPFKVTAWEHESELVLEKNPEYWDAESIKLDKITCKINAAEDTAADMMTAGELDLCEFGNEKQVETVMSTGNFEKKDFANGFQFLYINHKGKTEETGKWIGNADFRRALSLALDREALVKAVYTVDRAATRLTEPNAMGEEKTFHEEYPYEGYPATAQPEEAKEYLEKAMKTLGAKDVSEIPEITILCNDSNENMNCINAISDMWEKNLGVRSTVDAQPLNAMLDKVDAGDFDLWKGGLSSGVVDWVNDIGAELQSNQGNPMNYANEEYDRLYKAVSAAKTWKERKDAEFELEKHYCENTLAIHVVWSQWPVLYKKGITGIGATSAGNYDLTYADIEQQ